MRFRDLSLPARLYVSAVYALALLVVYLQSRAAGITGVTAQPAAIQASWWLFFFLTCGTAVAHSFPVSTPDRQSYHVSPPFFLAAVLLLEPLQLSALMAVANAAERF